MTIRSELLAIKGNKALLVAEEGVAWAAKHPRSALHRSLEWDDSVAGHKYRVWQVRALIAITLVDAKGRREYLSLTGDRVSGGYRSIEDAVRIPDLRAVMLEDALAELNRVRAKYRHLVELVRVFEEVEAVERRTAKKRKLAA